VVVISKANLAGSEQVARLKDHLQKFLSSRISLQADYEVRKLWNVDGAVENFSGQKVLLVSGVGRPESVKKTAAAHLTILQHKIFKDHHDYEPRDVSDLIGLADRLGAEGIVCTAKDAVKLRQFKELQHRLCWMELGLNVTGDVDELDREIDRLARQNP
jgi:tetraacyldisaccharide-1-P 4'-kinase